MEENVLEELGLSKREAKAYLALLEIGSTTIGKIIKKTDIPSAKIYEVLDRLIEKGLVNYLIIKSQKHFQAANPEALLDSFEEKKAKFEQLLPKLKEKQKFAGERQEVELYEGKQAMFTLLRNLVKNSKEGDEYLSFSLGQEHQDEEVAAFLSNLALRRIEKKMKIRALANLKYKEVIEKRYGLKLLKGLNTRYTKIDYPQGIVVLTDKVIMLEWGERSTAIKITSKKIADNYRKFFYGLYGEID